jgi:hypothetical protein
MMRLLSILLALAAAPLDAACRQALALGLDVSGSVDVQEYRLQAEGVAAALRHPKVVSAILQNPRNPVDIAIYEWSGQNFQRILVPWTTLDSKAVINYVAGRVDSAVRRSAPPNTALGPAMRFGADLLARRAHCWMRKLDISGDGRHNTGPHPRDVRAALQGRRITINGLVIEPVTSFDETDTDLTSSALSDYFKAWVILGPGAFVERAAGFEDYEAAMVRKLVRELSGFAVSRVEPRPRGPETRSMPGRR